MFKFEHFLGIYKCEHVHNKNNTPNYKPLCKNEDLSY